MRSSQVCGRALRASIIGVGLSLALVTPAAADPADAQAGAPAGPDDGAGVVEACKNFGAAINYAATNYEDFAYATAGNGNVVNYQDPSVQSSNAIGRTALREAASVAMSASTTAGVPPDVSAPMRAWSLHATKLLVIMGVRGGGDSLNSTANDMNTDAHNAQLACAANGARA